MCCWQQYCPLCALTILYCTQVAGHRGMLPPHDVKATGRMSLFSLSLFCVTQDYYVLSMSAYRSWRFCCMTGMFSRRVSTSA